MIRGKLTFLFIMLLFTSCQYISEETCRNSLSYYRSIGFNIMVLEKPVRNMDFYDVRARDLLRNRDTLIKIDRMFVVFPSLLKNGDIMTKEYGTTTVKLVKQDSIFGTNIFESEWTCEKDRIINGDPVDVWRKRSNAAGYPYL